MSDVTRVFNDQSMHIYDRWYIKKVKIGIEYTYVLHLTLHLGNNRDCVMSLGVLTICS